MSSITLIVGSYTTYLSILHLIVEKEEISSTDSANQDDLENLMFSKSEKKEKKSQPKWEIKLITNIMDSGLKPGVCELKYIKEQYCVLSGSFDHRARLYRIKKHTSPKLVGLLKHHKKIINSIDYRMNEDGTWEVLIGSEDGAVTLWTLPF